MSDALVMHDPVAAVGLLVGGVGLSMAVYLALVTPRQIQYRYTLAFFLVGSFLVLSNTNPFVSVVVADGLRLLALLGVLVLEGGAFKWVLDTSRERVDSSRAAGVVEDFLH